MEFFKLEYTFSYLNKNSNDLIKDCKEALQTPLKLVTIETVEEAENHVAGYITCYRWAKNIESLKDTLDQEDSEVKGEYYCITNLSGVKCIKECTVL